MPPPTPICPNCDYDLRTQVELQHPNYAHDASPIEIHCDDCGHTFIWPRVTPEKSPRVTGFTKHDFWQFFIVAFIAAFFLGILAVVAI
tara:strand:- start:6554 stop:6817 length:264 start_codon:yes stop_codon:yes gene_type:complete